jgi:oligopeptide transport system ATP-binding protein
MSRTLSIEDLSVSFVQDGVHLPAVRQVSLVVAARECVGIVGESGSGKTQVFMAAMGLLAANARAQGRVRFEEADILGASPSQLNRIRGSKLSMIFQDPMTSLTPHLKIGAQLAEVMVCHGGKSWSEARIAARRMLERVRVPEPERRLNQYPHELSGGLRQRVMIGMSLLCDPSLVIADEPTTALDVTVQAQIIDLLLAMRREIGMALVLISHDLGVVAGLADRILVMYAGRIVESGAAAELFGHARHPYTAELLKCIPRLSGPRLERLPTLPGQPPQPGDSVAGCAFAPRCPRAAERCRVERPLLEDVGSSRGGAAPDGAAMDGITADAVAQGGRIAHPVACHFPLTQ